MKFLSYNYDTCCYVDKNTQTHKFLSFVELKEYANDNIIVCNKALLNDAYKQDSHKFIDIIEFFVFLYPNASCSFNIFSIYKYLTKYEINVINDKNQNLLVEVEILQKVFYLLLNTIDTMSNQEKDEVLSISNFMKRDNWFFCEFIENSIVDKKQTNHNKTNYINIWNHIPEYKDEIKQADNLNANEEINYISKQDIENEYNNIVARFSQSREEQKLYANFVGGIFSNNESNKNYSQKFLFAEAGTGIGKTIGYLASAIAFLKKNSGHQVLISTYSKALQRQVIKEIEVIFNTQNLKQTYTLAKGSNNYICLLNYETLLNDLLLFPKSSIFLGILAKWLLKNKQGDLIGGDLSSLFFYIFNDNYVNFVINKKEECIHSKCKYFKKCFVMKSKLKAKTSNLVVSNHSYSLLNNCLEIPYVIFDEAHHLFNSADEIFSYEYSISSINSLATWICGSNTKANKAKSYFNGLQARVGIYLLDNGKLTIDEKSLNIQISSYIDILIQMSQEFCNSTSLHNILNNLHQNIFDNFFKHIYLYVLSNNKEDSNYYTQEVEVNYLNFSQDFIDVLQQSIHHLNKILKHSTNLYKSLSEKLYYLEPEDKRSLQDLIHKIELNLISKLLDFINMLSEIQKPENNFIYRFMVIKIEGKIIDIVFAKNYLNPMQPFAYNVLNNLQGSVFTSATLLDNHGVEEKNLEMLYKKFGLNHLEHNPFVGELNFLSPFNYKDNSKILIININQDNELPIVIEKIFKACGGGALAIFTAITRLKNVYSKIYQSLNSQGIKVVAQHINNQKLVNLIDIFKDDVNSCLLGTDSARDGIDIPGESLKLVLFEKIPWPKPDILLKHRLEILGSGYSSEIVKYKLRQAFGRLIRTHNDRGIFVIFAKSFPSAFIKSFPPNVEIHKVNVEESIKLIKNFY